MFFVFKQKTAYEMRISDWSSDVCSSDLLAEDAAEIRAAQALRYRVFYESMAAKPTPEMAAARRDFDTFDDFCDHLLVFDEERGSGAEAVVGTYRVMRREGAAARGQFYTSRSEEHTSELQSLMRISYAVFCLKKKINQKHI